MFIYPAGPGDKGLIPARGRDEARFRSSSRVRINLTAQGSGYYYKSRSAESQKACQAMRDLAKLSLALMGISPAVGRLTLAQEAEVRILYPQPPICEIVPKGLDYLQNTSVLKKGYCES